MNTFFLVLQSALFGFISGLLFPIDSHPLVFFSLILTNTILVAGYGATKDD